MLQKPHYSSFMLRASGAAGLAHTSGEVNVAWLNSCTAASGDCRHLLQADSQGLSAPPGAHLQAISTKASIAPSFQCSTHCCRNTGVFSFFTHQFGGHIISSTCVLSWTMSMWLFPYAKPHHLWREHQRDWRNGDVRSVQAGQPATLVSGLCGAPRPRITHANYPCC